MTSYASRALAALQETAARLTTAGVRTSLERGEVHLPGAWLAGQTAQLVTLAGGARLRCHLYLVVADNGDIPSSKQLWQLLDKTLAVLDPDGDIDTTYGLVLPSNPQVPLPAFRVPFDLDI